MTSKNISGGLQHVWRYQPQPYFWYRLRHIGVCFGNYRLTDGFVTFEPQHEISNNVKCATSKASDQPAQTRSLIRALCSLLEYSTSVKLPAEHHLEFLSLKRDCTGLSESTLVKMPHCWKSHVTAQLVLSHVIFVKHEIWVGLARRETG